MSSWQASLCLVATGPTTFIATISDEWSVGTFPDGGYVAAAAVRAMSELVDFPDPVSVTTTFLRPVEPGTVTIKVEADDGDVTSEEAVSMGLIATELVINALKYAFPNNAKGNVIVRAMNQAQRCGGWRYRTTASASAPR